MNDKKRKIDFFTVLKYFFYFIFIAVHVQMLRGTLEVVPALIPVLSEQTDAILTQRYTRTRRSSNSTSRYSNHSTTSYYLEATFNKGSSEYTNTDLVEETLYDSLDIGDQVKINYLKGIPQIAILEANKDHGVNNHVLLTSILLGVDLLIWLVWRWFKKWRQKHKKVKK